MLFLKTLEEFNNKIEYSLHMWKKNKSKKCFRLKEENVKWFIIFIKLHQSHFCFLDFNLIFSQ